MLEDDTVTASMASFLTGKLNEVSEFEDSVKKYEIRRLPGGRADKKSSMGLLVTGYVPTKWVVFGNEFQSKKSAAEHFGVSPCTIRTWCKGLRYKGRFIEPKQGCYAEEQ